MKNSNNKDTMRAEYKREDLGKPVRGKFLKSYRARTNVVLLKPDIAASFPTADAVDRALRLVLEIGKVIPPSTKVKRSA